MNSTENINTDIAKSAAAANRGINQAGNATQDAISKAAEIAHPAVDRFTAGAHQAVEKLMNVASSTADTVAHRSEQLMDAQERLVEDCRTYVRQKPVTALAIAAGIGYVLSHLLSKRH